MPADTKTYNEPSEDVPDRALVEAIERVLVRYDSAGWSMPIDWIARDLAAEIQPLVRQSVPCK